MKHGIGTLYLYLNEVKHNLQYKVLFHIVIKYKTILKMMINL